MFHAPVGMWCHSHQPRAPAVTSARRVWKTHRLQINTNLEPHRHGFLIACRRVRKCHFAHERTEAARQNPTPSLICSTMHLHISHTLSVPSSAWQRRAPHADAPPRSSCVTLRVRRHPLHAGEATAPPSVRAGESYKIRKRRKVMVNKVAFIGLPVREGRFAWRREKKRQEEGGGRVGLAMWGRWVRGNAISFWCSRSSKQTLGAIPPG